MVYNWLDNVRQLFTTTDCVVCGATNPLDIGLCPSCQANLPVNQYACPRCATPLVQHSSVMCGQCQTQLPHYDSAFVPYHYAPPVAGFITGLKFNARLAHARLLGTLLRDALLRDPPSRPECLLPVPLHPLRIRQRGFNQALEIARPVSQGLSLPVLTRGISRCRPTLPQTELDADLRRKNMRGAFRIDGELGAHHIAIIDDVITTASTVDELARVLKKAGAITVQVWATARA
jgi:ComF family protein